jgi:hypothetical protein
MRIEQIATAAVENVLGRLVRRLLVAASMLVLAVIALYYFVGAGEMSLAARFGELQARFIMGGIFSALALIALIALWAMRGKTAKSASPVVTQVRELQVAMLVEAVMLGYTLARRSSRAS